MKIFTKLKPKSDQISDKEPKKNIIKYKNDFLEILEYEDSSFVRTPDEVFCIPYLIEKNQFLIKKEYIKPFKWRDGNPYYLYMIGGEISKEESPEEALLRELQIQGGLVLSPEYKIDFEIPYFLSDRGTSKIHFCVINLSERDYHEVPITTKDTPPSRVDLKYLNNLITGDILTDWGIMKFKNYLNIG